MGVRNRERRRTKQKARGQHRRTAPPPHVAEMVVAAAVSARQRGDADEEASCVRVLAAELSPSVADRALFGCLERGVAEMWRLGWQPADLVRLAVREFGARHARLTTDAIAGQMRVYASATVDRRWADQLRALDAIVWWEQDGDYLTAWGAREGIDRAAMVGCAVEVLYLFAALPRVPVLGPLPGTARRTATAAGPPVEQRVLNKVRALLAKAESTEFPDEAEALTAKAQEFMARHSINAALLAAASAVRDEPTGCRVGIDAPYEASKALLLQEVAEANRCRMVWSRELGFGTVLGFEADLAAVELLFMSLLVQATTSVVRAGTRRNASGGSRTRSFRQSFLTAFAVRIGQRLRGVAADATQAADSALLPVLAAREDSVREKIETHFPGLVQHSVGTTDREGWASGTAAADQAVIHAGAGYVGAHAE